MRFFWTFFWAILISAVISYVLTSMAGNAFDVTSMFVVAILMSLAVFLLGEGVLKNGEEQ
ncbi:Protein of unknown function [Lentibacillus persicus]|uniref:DUF2929 domain-containing protein n=1 Tax=Lentibacillus persicus TaxID=640948 RepID=A0A1I1RW07_9BACI|nr:DUF2929 family protein [Lentibacillus persicus]SFD38445.1 Protein of unknown function [Lentibacillus persicus]